MAAETPFGASFGDPRRYMGQSPLAEIGKALKTGGILYGLQKSGAIEALDKMGIKSDGKGGFNLPTTQPAGADGNLIGSWFAEVNLNSAAAATSLTDGDSIELAANTTLAAGVLGTASVAGNNSAMINLAFKNTSTNVTSTVSLQFRSENAGATTTAQIGTNVTGYILG